MTKARKEYTTYTPKVSLKKGTPPRPKGRAGYVKNLLVNLEGQLSELQKSGNEYCYLEVEGCSHTTYLKIRATFGKNWAMSYAPDKSVCYISKMG